MLTVGTKAPEFTLQDKEGKAVSLSDFLGKKVVLYFYPKDNTPGCTRQACAFAAQYGGAGTGEGRDPARNEVRGGQSRAAARTGGYIKAVDGNHKRLSPYLRSNRYFGRCVR